MLQCNIVHGDSSVYGAPCNISACTPSSVVVPQLQMIFVTFIFVKLQKPFKIMLWTDSPGDPGILALIIWPRGWHAHGNIDTRVHLKIVIFNCCWMFLVVCRVIFFRHLLATLSNKCFTDWFIKEEESDVVFQRVVVVLWVPDLSRYPSLLVII